MGCGFFFVTSSKLKTKSLDSNANLVQTFELSIKLLFASVTENAPVEFRSRTEPPKTQISRDERSLIPIESFFRKILLYDLFSEICL